MKGDGLCSSQNSLQWTMIVLLVPSLSQSPFTLPVRGNGLRPKLQPPTQLSSSSHDTSSTSSPTSHSHAPLPLPNNIQISTNSSDYGNSCHDFQESTNSLGLLEETVQLFQSKQEAEGSEGSSEQEVEEEAGLLDFIFFFFIVVFFFFVVVFFFFVIFLFSRSFFSGDFPVIIAIQ
jgi:hypothetical protein